MSQKKWSQSLEELELDYRSWRWLSDGGSLTKELRRQAGCEQLILTVLSQNKRLITPAELDYLNPYTKSEDEQNIIVIERCIIMSVMGNPWLYAKSVFTPQGQSYLGQDLSNLNNNSIGELLLKSYPEINRGLFQYSYLNIEEDIHRNINNYYRSINKDLNYNNIFKNNLIERRSQYKLNDYNTVLFSLEEVFLPALINKKLQLEVDVL